MSILDKFLEISKAELGVSEWRNGKSNPRIIFYDSFTSLKSISDVVPWCSAFVCFVIETVMGKGSSTGSAAARSYLEWGKEIEKPVPGCITVFKRGTDPNQGHVNFYLNDVIVNPNEPLEFIKCRGGNQNGAVCDKIFYTKNILSHRVPHDYPS